ncbi:MAG: tetratricopeptide repeat protein, partial [Candidatus Krumholzibacteriia bacterium]
MSRWSAIGCALLVTLTPRGVSGETPNQRTYRIRLLERLASGDADSARVLVGSERIGSRRVVDHLLADYVQARLENRRESATQSYRSARTIAELYAREFGDSLCLRQATFYDGLTDATLPSEVTAWERYLETRRLHESSQWQAAQEILPDVVRLARLAGDPYLEQRAEALSGYCLHVLGLYEEARGPYRRALELSRGLRDPTREARLLANIAFTYQAQDRLDEALESFLGVLQSARRAHDWELYVGTLNGLGVQFHQRGDLDSAQVFFEEGLTLARERGIEDREAEILSNMGSVFEERG